LKMRVWLFVNMRFVVGLWSATRLGWRPLLGSSRRRSEAQANLLAGSEFARTETLERPRR
jgi:hypothetical protein